VNRKFSCETPPCPQMRYCAKNRKESLEGPTSCDNVKCSNGFVCTVRLRQCNWESCREQVARCVTEMEFHDGPASCTGYKCPLGEDCILRESICREPPCKLFKACFNKREIKTWLEKCKSIGCLSPHECFLRKPEKLCGFSKCTHSPDCLART
ncbi:GSCOCG00009684001-RA-CDS, partial [Cotesia congregata]